MYVYIHPQRPMIPGENLHMRHTLNKQVDMLAARCYRWVDDRHCLDLYIRAVYEVAHICIHTHKHIHMWVRH